MEVRLQPKDEVVRQLRARTLGMEHRRSVPTTGAVFHYLDSQADRVQAAPGATLEEAGQLTRSRLDRLRFQRRALMGVGLPLTVGGLGWMLQAGLAAAPRLGHAGLGLALALAGTALTCAGMNRTHPIRDQECQLNALERSEQELTAPPPTPRPVGDPLNLVVNPLTCAAPEHTKDELMAVLKATRDYLQARQDEPGMWTAQFRVEGDLDRIGRTPGTTLFEMRERVSQETREHQRGVRRNFNLAALSALAGTAALLLPGPLRWVGLGAGVAGLLGFLSKGCYDQVSIESNQSLTSSINDWSMQLDGLKQVSGSGQMVEQLAGNPRGNLLEVGQGTIVVGGVRIPVRRQRSSL